jgi:hypothetical protein
MIKEETFEVLRRGKNERLVKTNRPRQILIHGLLGHVNLD